MKLAKLSVSLVLLGLVALSQSKENKTEPEKPVEPEPQPTPAPYGKPFENDTYIADYIKIDGVDSLYFMMFLSRSDPKTDPLIIWL